MCKGDIMPLTSNQMKQAITLIKITDFLRFGNWKKLGSCTNTTQQNHLSDCVFPIRQEKHGPLALYSIRLNGHLSSTMNS